MVDHQRPLRARPVALSALSAPAEPADEGGQVVQAGERRSARVESLRALAAVAVLVSHVWLYSNDYGPTTTDTWLHRVLAGGGFGVQLFFALSGYLIYRPFARRDFAGGGSIALGTYARNRAVRILPLYWVAVAVLLIFTEQGGTFTQWAHFGLFAESFSTSTAQTVNPPMWSIVVELHFYLLLPLLAWGLATVCRGRRGLAVAALLALAVPSILLRRLDPDPAVIWQYSLPATFFGFVPGMVLAIVGIEWSDRRPRWLRGVLRRADAWLAASVLVWLVVCWQFDWAVPLTAVAAFLTVGAVVLPLEQGALVRMLDWRPLALVGVASYSLYIWHVPFIEELTSVGSIGDSFPRMLPIALALSLAVAATSYALIERPALRLRRGWVRERSSGPHDASPIDEAGAAEAAGRADRRWLWLILAVGFLVRARTIMATRHLALGNDPGDYDRLGRLFADGIVFGESLISPSGGPTAFRPPLYPAFLGVVYWFSGDSILAARFVQALLGLLSILLVWLIARRLFGRRTALGAAAIAAVYPPLVLATVALMSESVFVPLMLGAVLAALYASDGGRGGTRWAILSGVCMGLGVLTRPNGAALVPALVLVVLAWRRSGRARSASLSRAAWMLAAVAAVLLPWQIRNLVVMDGFVPVSTIDGYNIAGVYNDDAAIAEYPNRFHFRPPNGVPALTPLFADGTLDEVSLGSELRAAGLDFIRARPTAPLVAELWNSVRMLELSGLEQSAVVAQQSGYDRQTAGVAMLAFWVLAALAAGGAALAATRRAPPVLWLAPALLWLGTALFLGDARVRAPIDVFLILPAAVALVALVDGVRSIIRRGRWPGLAVDGNGRADPPFRLGFRPALEGLRGVAVALVVAFHVITFMTPGAYGRGLLEGSFIGVDIFFVLSGFLITSLLLEEFRRRDTIALGAFYLRRAARLLPAVVALLVVSTCYVLITGLDVGTHLRTSTMILTYSSNWFFGRNAEISDGFGHMWSLAIEEQFYLVWPLALLVILRVSRRDLRWVFAVAGAGIVGATLLRSALYASSGIWSKEYFRTDVRADQLLWGVVLAVALQAGWIRPRANTVLAAIAGGTIAWLAATMSLFASMYYEIGATLVAMATATLVLTSLDSEGRPARILSIHPLRFLGQISYALYLWHVPMIVVVLRYLGDRAIAVQIVVALSLSFAAATASTRLIEQPFLRMKARWEKVAKPTADTTEDVESVGVSAGRR